MIEQDDPAANPDWVSGCDYAITQLASVLGVDPKSFSWDAATETLDGDVQSVIGNALVAAFGDDWQDRKPAADEQEAVEAMARAHYEDYFGGLIGCCEPAYDGQSLSFRERGLSAMTAALRALNRGPRETEPDAWLLVTDDGERYVSCNEAFYSTEYAGAYPLYKGDALPKEPKE